MRQQTWWDQKEADAAREEAEKRRLERIATLVADLEISEKLATYLVNQELLVSIGLQSLDRRTAGMVIIG